MRRTWARGVGAFVIAGICACGSANTESSARVASPAALPSTAAEPLPSQSLTRSQVKQAVHEGLGAFLRHVEVDERPVFVGGKFYGFRIRALRGDSRFWNGVDLRPGDIVKSVNGFPIERPENALEAFQSLQVASELRVALDRDGQAKELRYAIVDDAPSTPTK